MCCKAGEKIHVSYDTKVVTNNANIEPRNATSIYFSNKGGTSAFVNDIEIGAGETFALKNDPCEVIVTNLQVTFGQPVADIPFGNILNVLYEYKTIVTQDCKK